jgi:TPR repeat protein
VALLEKAAGHNDADALFQLGALYMAGHGVERSTDLAFDYCKRAAELGHADAQYEVAAMYALGRGTPIDESLALQWGRKAVAQNHTKAKYSIGRMLLIGEYPEQKAEAVKLLEQAAGENISEAALFLAESYADGLHGLPANRARAIEILQPVAQRGHPEAGLLMQRLNSSAD